MIILSTVSSLFKLLTLHQQRNTINTISKKEKQVEDIILLIEKNIGSMVDITSITKQSQQTENSNQTILEVRFSSNLNDIFNLNQKLKELNLENSIETIKVPVSYTHLTLPTKRIV